jgi:hypothetical protein
MDTVELDDSTIAQAMCGVCAAANTIAARTIDALPICI